MSTVRGACSDRRGRELDRLSTGHPAIAERPDLVHHGVGSSLTDTSATSVERAETGSARRVFKASGASAGLSEQTSGVNEILGVVTFFEGVIDRRKQLPG
jgi:hypothetical protein